MGILSGLGKAIGLGGLAGGLGKAMSGGRAPAQSGGVMGKVGGGLMGKIGGTPAPMTPAAPAAPRSTVRPMKGRSMRGSRR